MQGNTFFGFSGGGGSTPPPVSNSWLLNGNTEGAEKYFGTNDNFSIPIYTNGSAIGVFLNTGDFGFGTIAPTSRVHIKGDATASNFALKVDNSASSPLLYVRNDGNVGIGTSTPTAKLDVRGQVVAGNGVGSTTTNDSPFYAVRTNTGNPNYYTGYQYAFEVGGGIWGIGMNYANNEYQFLSTGSTTAKFIFGSGNPTTPNGKFLMDLNGGYFGSNTTSPTANIHAKGIDATSSNYALKVDNSSASPLLYVRNDGKVGVGIATPLLRFSVKPSGNLDGIILQEDASNFYASFQKDGTKGFLALYDTNVTKVIFNSPSYSVSDFVNTGLSFGIGSIFNTGTGAQAQLHVYGINATTSICLRLEPVLAVTEDTTGNTVSTTNATLTTAQTIAVPTDKVISLESTIVYRKTAGAGLGTVGDGTTIKLNSSVKNVAGTLTLDTVQNTYTGTTNAIAGVSATYTISGTNVLVSVTGVLNDNITWNVITKVNTVA